MPATCSTCGIRGDGRKIMWVGGTRRRCGARDPADALSLAKCQLRVGAQAHLDRFSSPPPPPAPPPIRMVIPGPAWVREQQLWAELMRRVDWTVAGIKTANSTAGKIMETLDDYKERMPEQCYLELANLTKKVYDSSVRNF